MKKDIISIISLIAGIIALVLFVTFSILQYSINSIAFEVLKDISLTISITMNISFSFRIYKISISQSFNNNQIIINKGISNHDEELTKKLEKPFDNLKKYIEQEETYNPTNFYSLLYECIPPILNNFSSPKYIFQNANLQNVFNGIKDTMSNIENLYYKFGFTNICGDMAKTYIAYRNQLSELINKFYITLAKND